MPDVPVHSAFDSSGRATITVELDPRCFEEDPESAPYVLAKDFDSSATPEVRTKLIETARAYLPTVVEFEFKPGGKVVPDFSFTFTTKQGEDLGVPDAVTFLAASASVDVPAGARSYRLHAIDHGYLTVMFHNELDGKPVEQFQALFPGESSDWLDLPLGVAPSGRSNLPLLILGSLLVLGVVGWISRRATSKQ
jgi:hypothetical protein